MIKLIENYFSEGKIWYNADKGPKEYTTMAGIPEGLLLCSLLWNIMYNEVFVFSVPKEATFSEDQVYTNDTKSARKTLDETSLDLQL